VFAAGIWWLGASVVSLAFDEDRRGAPYYVLHLVSGADAEEGAGYLDGFGALVRAEDGQLLWRGALEHLHSGRLGDAHDDLLVYEFAAGGDLVQMLTSAQYRSLHDRLPAVLLGTAASPDAIVQDEVLLLWLLELRDTGAQGNAEGLLPVVASARRFEGHPIWNAPVDVVAGGATWNHLVVLAFPESAAARRWLEDMQTVTELALVRRVVAEQALLEFGSGR
jgi:uncharacterized protein (DUF1330 family)